MESYDVRTFTFRIGPVVFDVELDCTGGVDDAELCGVTVNGSGELIDFLDRSVVSRLFELSVEEAHYEETYHG